MNKEKLLALYEECEVMLERMKTDEDYKIGVFYNLGRIAEKGDAISVLKLGIIAVLTDLFEKESK